MPSLGNPVYSFLGKGPQAWAVKRFCILPEISLIRYASHYSQGLKVKSGECLGMTEIHCGKSLAVKSLPVFCFPNTNTNIHFDSLNTRNSAVSSNNSNNLTQAHEAFY